MHVQCAKTVRPDISLTLPEEREQLCLDLESVINLYRTTAQCAPPHDRLSVAASLTGIRRVLCEDEVFQPLNRNDVMRIKDLLKDLRSHVNIIALKNLDTEVGEVKSRLGRVEERMSNARYHPLQAVGYDLQENDGMWHRIATKRKDLLGPSSLLPKEKHLLRQPHKKSNKDSTETKIRHKYSAEKQRHATEFTDTEGAPAFQERINRLQHKSVSKRSLQTASEAVRRAHCLLHQSERSRRRAEKARQNGILKEENADRQGQETQCEECLQLMRERDLFWGLESDSKSTSSSEHKGETMGTGRDRKASTATKKDIEEFLASLPSTREYDTQVSVQLSSSQSLLGARKPPGVAGRGTWATPAYIPPWTVRVLRNSKEKDQKAKTLVSNLRGTRQGFFKKWKL